MNWKSKLQYDDGNILIMSIVITALLFATAFGYMKWASDERWDTAYEQATVQAYFLAQTGLIERGYLYLRTRKPSELPTATVYLPAGNVEDIGSHYNNKVVIVHTMGDQNVFQRTDTYDLYSTGRAQFVNHQLGNRNYGEPVRIERTAKMRAKLRSFSNYMYLTQFEETRFNETIWFWGRDTLYGRTHSNDWIGIKGRPVFYGPVSTSKNDFIRGENYNPYFEFPPKFKVPEVQFPKQAETLRSNSTIWIDDNGGERMTRVWLQGERGIYIYQYILGSIEPELYNPVEGIIFEQHESVQPWGAIFVDGQCEIYGDHAGRLTIGSSGDMWLVDNIRYVGANEENGYVGDNSPQAQLSFPHMLGLVSESNIIIKDNFVNGRANSVEGSDIIINAGLVALGESFTFEHQNDSWELYQGPAPDERGDIHLIGAVTQVRRGYVHRSNHNGTGYNKDYHYDFRFDVTPPPYYLEALDEEGHGLFDVVSWGELGQGD
ncbi:DUF4900 domain-containing protein [bacterium]|nr:DUF4900 domain-containing protein [bacterium]